GIEAEVVGAAGVAVADGGDAEVFERSDPLGKDGADGEVLLGVDAADLAGAVVEVVVGVERLPLPGGGQCAVVAEEARRSRRVRRIWRSEGAEVILHVAQRAVEALLFTGPEGNSDRPARLEVQRLEDADGLHRDDRAGAVVGGSGAGDPA